MKNEAIQEFDTSRFSECQRFVTKCADIERQIDDECRASRFGCLELERHQCDLRLLRLWSEQIKAAVVYTETTKERSEELLRRCEDAVAKYAYRVLEASIAGD